MRARSRLVAPVKAASVLAAASLTSLSLLAAAAPAASAAAPTALEGGAVGLYVNSILGVPLNIAQPAVVTPPGGGSRDATLGGISIGGLPPLIPPFLTAGVSAVHTDGTLAGGGAIVNSSAKLAYFTLSLLGINLHAIASSCTANDPATGKPALTANTTLVGQIGQSRFYGNAAPNQTIKLGLLTVVINEQVVGQSSDGHPGILVNAVHIYTGTPGPTYSNQGLILAESRCEVAPVPIPPGIIPETSFPVALPITAAAAGGLGLLVIRSRRRRHQMA